MQRGYRHNLLACHPTKTIERGNIPREHAETSVVRVLEMVKRAIDGEKLDTYVDHAEHHALARRMVAELIVLLKNERQALPLRCPSGERVLIVGEGAKKPVIQGSGCATTLPTQVDIPWTEMEKLADGITLSWSQGETSDADQIQVIHPEHIQLCAASDALLHGKISERIYAGSETHLVITLTDGARFIVRSNRTSVGAIGDAVSLSWYKANARLLSA